MRFGLLKYLLVVAAAIGLFLFFQHIDLLERLFEATRRYEDWELDDLIVAALVAVLCGVVLLAKTAMDSARARNRSEERFRDVAEVSGDWIWEQDAKRRFTYVSGRFEEITGIRKDDLLGRTREEWAGRFAARDLKAQQDKIDRREAFRELEYAFRGEDGRVFHFSTSGKPILGKNGRFLGYRGTGTDITGRKVNETLLQEALEEAQAASRAKTAFMANMSHELRTPLNAIIGFAEVLESRRVGTDDPTHGNYVRYIRESAHHLLAIINDVLDIAQVEAGRVELHRQPVALDEAVAMILTFLTPELEKKAIKVINEVPHGLARVHADPQRLRQILLNLLGNAVKFTPAGKLIRIRAAPVSGSDRLRIEIADEGIGIPADQLEAVFQPFVQLDSGLNRKHEGSGLGLALVKHHVELHGGTITLQSEPGEGTVARVELPISVQVKDSAA